MPKRVDRNQATIVAALRRIGAMVAITSDLGRGFPDLCVSFRNVNYLLEVKDPTQRPSDRRLTPAEKEFHATWRGPIAVVETVAEAYAAIGAGVTRQ